MIHLFRCYGLDPGFGYGRRAALAITLQELRNVAGKSGRCPPSPPPVRPSPP